MLINVVDGQATVVDGSVPESIEILGRLSDEFKGFCEYHRLHKHTGDSRYQQMSEQEFTHFLCAMGDLVKYLKHMQPSSAIMQSLKTALTETATTL